MNINESNDRKGAISAMNTGISELGAQRIPHVASALEAMKVMAV